ncbi:Fen2p [Sugiyamaella lignohabitans]|uniref:Fen2p n=1 Tax=Sugiyamaella lignohabitans TaxID=796027 RepID=A0A167ESQ1_9ASCO|nr:Fen2p [Sugiyamaella lignohabitans]ANB14412.1 Fen2p [Sugiyamaella lignohabitans]
MLGSWYKKNELGKRAAIFVSVGDIGSMAGGWIQAGLFARLDGHGLPAWRLIFIVVFAMTIPFVFLGLIAIPDLPRHENAWFLSDEEKKLAIDRLQRHVPTETMSLRVVWRAVKSWQFWLMPFIFFLYGVSVQMLGNNVMPLWMKSRGYTVVQMNNYPTVIFAFAIVGTLGYSFLSDRLGSRWQASVAIGFTFTLCCPILLSNNVPDGAKFFAFFFLGTCLAPQALWFTWCADVTSHDLYLRSITTGWMNAIDEAFIAWWPIVFYPVTDAPTFRTGYIASLVLGTLIVPTVGAIVYLDRRDQRLHYDADSDDEQTPIEGVGHNSSQRSILANDASKLQSNYNSIEVTI